MSQEAVAEMAEISAIYYQSIEAGRRTNVSVKILDKLSKVYGLELHQFFSPTFSEKEIVVACKIQPPHRSKKMKI